MGIIHCLLIWKKDCNEYIFAGTGSGFVHIWELMDYREAGKNKVCDGSCLSISYDKNSDEFLTQEKGGQLSLWTLGKTILDWTLKEIIELDYVGFCKSLYNYGTIIAPSHDSKVVVIRSSEKKEMYRTDKASKLGEVICLKYLKSSDSIMVAYECGDLAVWDICSSKETTRTSMTTDHPMAFDFCELTGEGVLGSNSATLIKFQFSDMNLKPIRTATMVNSGVSSISIRKDGKLCVVGCWDGRIKYYSMKTLKLLACLSYHRECVECVVFSEETLKCTNDQTLLTAGGKDGRITLWTLYSNK
ncbi:hypothetical protein AAG570_013648 [Ranatra chinensis]|uniref:Anaphase-promoting complex subunit 4-like WD40 domain-containing protein n=1 Tax=Ranatra chinensis TaxID=642074 RepID=A0ABD0YPF5_9HEMI